MKEGESIDTREHGNSRIDGRVDTVVELPIYSLVDNEWMQSAYVGYRSKTWLRRWCCFFSHDWLDSYLIPYGPYHGMWDVTIDSNALSRNYI